MIGISRLFFSLQSALLIRQSCFSFFFNYRYSIPQKRWSDCKNRGAISYHSKIKDEFDQNNNYKLTLQSLSTIDKDSNSMKEKPFLIHWKGEVMDGYSYHFRIAEWEGALRAIYHDDNPYSSNSNEKDITSFEYENALLYDQKQVISDKLRLYYDSSMQFLTVEADHFNTDLRNQYHQHVKNSAHRCSLIHAIYQVVALGDSYETCTKYALQNNKFADMYVGSKNQDDTWCVRVRQYDNEKSLNFEEKNGKVYPRHGSRARSMQEEKKALLALEPLLNKFGGGVDLKNPDCSVYFFKGLQSEDNNVVLARRLATGPQISSIAPATRICVTNTPLCPIAAFIMCNIAGVRSNSYVLDPFAGSCTTLLAAAMIQPSCNTMGIEIAHDGIVNRENIILDFKSRNLTRPLALIEGNAMDESIRDRARNFIAQSKNDKTKPKKNNDDDDDDTTAFDLIITDPPYGIRESYNTDNIEKASGDADYDPLISLLRCIGEDRIAGKRLLRKGGRLVAFIPSYHGNATIPSKAFFQEENLPPIQDALPFAGLRIIDMREQPLNDNLSRWLVTFSCIK